MRKSYSPEFKAKLVLEVFRGERLLNDIPSENNVSPQYADSLEYRSSNKNNQVYIIARL